MAPKGNTRVVLISESAFAPEKISVLNSILINDIDLICTVGRDCHAWEDAIDDLLESKGGAALNVVTTCHPNETIDEVVAFATSWPGKGQVVCVSA